MPGNQRQTTFFSSILSSGNQSRSVPLRATRRSASNASASSSWIVSELQQAQQLLQSGSTQPTTTTLDPSASPFYLHPRQSSHADLEAPEQQQPPQILSPHTIQVARAALEDHSMLIDGEVRTRRPSDDLIESYLSDEAEAEREAEIESFLSPREPIRFEVAQLAAEAGVPLQLQQALRNAAAIHNSVGMTVQNLRASNPSNPANTGTVRSMNPVNSALRNKIVYRLNCLYCKTHVCDRAMRAILLADTKIELYSTDIPPRFLKTMDEDRLTQGCNCRIRDTVCTGW